ncbi:MAG: FecR domain-containing protein [Deltaproteobacteria bacterium]|nr:FecR domain-containing protein [Deltaproteobacteria bacterium]
MILPLLLALAAPHATVVYVEGNVAIERAGKKQALLLGATLAEEDFVVTEEDSQIRVRLPDRSLLRVGPRSRVQLSKMSFPDAQTKTVSVKLIVGRLWASVSKLLGPSSKFEIESANAVAGVRGTELEVARASESVGPSITTVVGDVGVRVGGADETIVGAGQRLSLNLNGSTDALSRLSATELSAMRDDSRALSATRLAATSEQAPAPNAFLARRPVIGMAVDAAEQRQRSADVFGPYNDASKGAQLFAKINPPPP